MIGDPTPRVSRWQIEGVCGRILVSGRTLCCGSLPVADRIRTGQHDESEGRLDVLIRGADGKPWRVFVATTEAIGWLNPTPAIEVARQAAIWLNRRAIEDVACSGVWMVAGLPGSVASLERVHREASDRRNRTLVRGVVGRDGPRASAKGGKGRDGRGPGRQVAHNVGRERG
jgi:hypothetical protein